MGRDEGAMSYQSMSVYELHCVCDRKGPIRTTSLSVICDHCGRQLVIESWQIQHTLNAQGLLMKNPPAARTDPPPAPAALAPASPAPTARSKPRGCA